MGSCSSKCSGSKLSTVVGICEIQSCFSSCTTEEVIIEEAINNAAQKALETTVCEITTHVEAAIKTQLGEIEKQLESKIEACLSLDIAEVHLDPPEI